VTAQTIAELVQGVFLCGDDAAKREVRYAFAADLMSDVLTLTHDDVLFITGLVAPQTIRTAVVSDISTILFVRNKSIPTSIVEIAKENEITVISSPFTMYRASGTLFRAGLEAIY
jgi:serine kinase of HPr protein (carbohydrate metabolism regulator)